MVFLNINFSKNNFQTAWIIYCFLLFLNNVLITEAKIFRIYFPELFYLNPYIDIWKTEPAKIQ